jgi:hypothetical protein
MGELRESIKRERILDRERTIWIVIVINRLYDGALRR